MLLGFPAVEASAAAGRRGLQFGTPSFPNYNSLTFLIQIRPLVLFKNLNKLNIVKFKLF